jgi:hypothetical protein
MPADRFVTGEPLIKTVPCALTVIVWSAAALLWSGNASAQRLPVPPCAGAPFPAAGDVGAALNQRVWIDDELAADWSPADCTGWTQGPTKVLLAAAGRFAMSGDTDEVVAILARISAMTEIVYWSSSRSRWRRLFEEAAALAAPDRQARRADFTAEEFEPGASLHYWLKEDNPTAGVVYRLLIHEKTPSRLVFETVNLTPLRASVLLLGARIAAPGEFRQIYYIEQQADSTWSYYSLVRLGRASTLAGTSEANYRNRAEAYFRYIAQLKMDREPPAAR